jgi:hypothetical protein
MEEIPGLKTPLEYIPKIVREEIRDAVERTLDAGAEGPLDYVGAGAYGIVLCDERNHAFKVGRMSPSKPSYEVEFISESLGTEFEFLRDAAQSSMAGHVARAYRFHPAEIVIERECVQGRPGVWGDDSRLHKIDKAIDQAMRPLGWTGPEFKEDSFIIKGDGREVLVDASMAVRIGMNLANWVQDVLEGRRKTRDDWQSIAYYVMSEIRHSEIPQELGYELIERLNERDPKIKPGFGLKGLGARDPEEDPFERYHAKDRRRRLIRHKYVKDTIDPAAIAACIYRPKSDAWSEHWYAITKGFPYDQGEWRVSVWDQRGPLSHYSDTMFHGPFKTLIEAVDDVLFEFRQARLVEYILPSGEHVRVGKGPSCF